jgi:hypothetical protein
MEDRRRAIGAHRIAPVTDIGADQSLKRSRPAAAMRRPDSLVSSTYSPFASAGTGKPRLRMRAAMPGSRPRNFL